MQRNGPNLGSARRGEVLELRSAKFKGCKKKKEEKSSHVMQIKMHVNTFYATLEALIGVKYVFTGLVSNHT